MMNTQAPRPAAAELLAAQGGIAAMTSLLDELDPSAYVFVDTAIGGVSRRNHPMNIADFHPPAGAMDTYITAFRYTSRLVEWRNSHANAAGNPTVSGYREAAWTPVFFLDFDAEADPAAAQRDAARLVRFLRDDCGSDARATGSYYSGHKGFHVTVPAALFGGFPPSRALPERLRALAGYIAAELGLATLDLGVYNHLRLFRVAGSRHGKTSRYKIPLTADELLNLSIEEIQALATQPRCLPPQNDEWLPRPALVALWQRTAHFAAANAAAAPERFAGPVPTGKRHSYVLGALGALRSRGASELALRHVAVTLNETELAEPLEAAELAGLVAHVGQFPAGADWRAIAQPAAEPWPAWQPLPQAPATPTMTAQMLPAPLRAWLLDAAGAACLPLECLAAPAMIAVAAVVGRSVAIRPWEFSNYSVVPNLWGAIVDRPGQMKTYAIGEALRPLDRLAAASRDRENAAASEQAADIAAGKASVEGLKQALAQAAKKGGDTGTLRDQLRDSMAALAALDRHEPRYTTNDPTVEKLADLLVVNTRGLLVKRDELMGWLKAMEKQGHEGDRAFYLEGWNGSGSFFIDRIGRGTTYVPAVTISICGGIQPGRLSKFVREAVAGESGDDGLLQRLQLTVWPDAPLAWNPPQQWPDQAARERVFALFDRLDLLTPAAIGAEAPADDIPFMTFDAAAQQLANAWRDDLEHRLRGDPLAAMPAFAAHLSKYRSLMPSLALLFALIDWAAADAPPLAGVSLAAAKLACAWCDFLELHARKVYAPETAPEIDAARAVAARITDGSITDGMTVRDLHRAGWADLADPTAIQAGLRVLQEAHWLRQNNSQNGGRPSAVVLLHPDLRPAANANA